MEHDLVTDVGEDLEALDARDEVEERVDDLGRTALVGLGLDAGGGHEPGARRPGIREQVGQHVAVHHHLRRAGRSLPVLLRQVGQVAGHAGEQAPVSLSQPALGLPHQDRVQLEEHVGGEAVPLVGGQELVEVDVGDAQLGEGEAVVEKSVHEGGVLARAGQEGDAAGAVAVHDAARALVHALVERRQQRVKRVFGLLDRGRLRFQLAQRLRHVAGEGQPAQVEEAEPPIGRAHRLQQALQRLLVLGLVAGQIAAGAVGGGGALGADLAEQPLQEAQEQRAELGMETDGEDAAAALAVGRRQRGQGGAQEQLDFRRAPGHEPGARGVLQVQRG